PGGRRDGRFIQTMPHPADDATHAQLPTRAEHHFQENLAFESELASLLGVCRVGFVRNLDRSRRGTGFNRALPAWCAGGLLTGEAGALYRPAPRAASVTLARGRDPAAKTRARDIPCYAFCATCAIAFAGSAGQIKRSRAGNLEVRVRLALARNSIGITKAAGLNFLNRSVDRDRSRTAKFSGLGGTKSTGIQLEM